MSGFRTVSNQARTIWGLTVTLVAMPIVSPNARAKADSRCRGIDGMRRKALTCGECEALSPDVRSGFALGSGA